MAHLGLGDATRADLVRIEWPSRIVQEVTTLDANQTVMIEERDTSASKRDDED